ncbi:hypothetical protein KM043_013056 [Ampulex compressa]|nr:hypothetical protein KM043_013056 [Ampulex compressa]
MVNQIPVPQAKYELLTDIRQPRWKVQVFCLTLIFLVISILFITRTWIGILILQSPKPGTLEKESIDNAQIAAWVRRARMYAESTKENQNADRNTSISASQQYSHDTSRQVIVCYYTISDNLNTVWELSPANIDPHICTHIIMGFARVVNCTLHLNENTKAYKAIVDLKNKEPKLKVMLSVGGNNELHNGFPDMVKNHANRKKFIKSALNITKIFDIDGLDIDWEFPAWMDAEDREKIHFVQLLAELRKEFNRSGRKLILSVAVAAPAAIIDQSYEVPEIAQYVDFVNIIHRISCNIKHNPLNHYLLAPANGFGKLGSKGFVPYPTICDFLRTGAKYIFEKESLVPYAFKDYEWISYDDEESIYYKAKWIRDNGFKGAMVYSLNVDDWNSTCNLNITFPLTRTVLKVFDSSGKNSTPVAL